MRVFACFISVSSGKHKNKSRLTAGYRLGVIASAGNGLPLGKRHDVASNAVAAAHLALATGKVAIRQLGRNFSGSAVPFVGADGDKALVCGAIVVLAMCSASCCALDRVDVGMLLICCGVRAAGGRGRQRAHAGPACVGPGQAAAERPVRGRSALRGD